ncbi:MAG: trypsin-like peptidase domain-containing protein [Deltaproteobacteria bacterium]|nr:trypsin-like peptidase domain-containing protein [Deltaproteobacteria bacterium]
MQCPKCGHDGESEVECPRCGLIFARYQSSRMARQAGELHAKQPSSEMSPRERPRNKGLLAAGVLLIVAATGWYLLQGERVVPPPGQVAVEVSSPETQPEPQPVEKNRKGVPPALPADSRPEGLAGQLAAAFPPANPVEEARNATVSIKTPWGGGSGFFVTANGSIVTNLHVVRMDSAALKTLQANVDKLAGDLERERRNIERVEGQLARVTDRVLKRDIEEELRRRREEVAKYTAIHQEETKQLQLMGKSVKPADVRVTLIDGTELAVQSVRLSDRTDLALLSVHCYNAPVLKPQDVGSQRMAQGGRVYTIGSPSGLRHTVTSGVISGFRERDGQSFIQTDAPINPGNSGGPLVDENGRVLGINTMILRDTQGIGFAIPIQAVREEFGLYIGE